MMIQTTVGVPMDAMVLNNYFRTLINLFFKILPIKESGESSLDTYMRSLRMDRAALLLRQEPQASVTEIAGRVGYDSASKFAAAFKDTKGKTPLEYRREGR